MLTHYLRQALRSPLPLLSHGLRHWWSCGARIRRARVLCQSADGLRLRRPAHWQARSDRLYRRSLRTLGELGGSAGEGTEAWGAAARRGLRAATTPYRALWLSLAGYAVLLAALVGLALTVAVLVSSNVRGRIFPRDLAAGRPWTASHADFGMSTTGTGPASDGSIFFHTPVVKDPWVEIDLGAEHLLRAVRVTNRADCCGERALPLNVEVWVDGAWRLVVQRRTAFDVWTGEFPPVRAQRIRLMRPGTAYFHLKSIQVFGQ